jgi:membrane-bound lytic murein transglycosylase B
MNIKTATFLAVCISVMQTSALAAETHTFEAWKQAFALEAMEAGLSYSTVKATFNQAKYLPRVIQLDRSQPEFISPFLRYLEKRVSPHTVQRGRDMLAKHQDLLDAAESQYGVSKHVLVAFWGLETHYGQEQGRFGLPSAISTLAFEGRRADFFRQELLNLMRIIDAEHANVSKLRGSWAGAMGHMQFMPSTFVKHAVDADADGKIDLWSSLPDAFNSAANYLKQAGWRTNEPIALQIDLPEGFDVSLAHYKKRKSVAEWQALGVALPSELKPTDQTAILLPQGWSGPAYMVFANFDVVMDWNRSVNYALAVAHLAQQFSGDMAVKYRESVETQALTFNEMWALQAKLNELGFDCGKPDGFPGLKTQDAVRLYQAAQQLPQDGYASPSLYQRLFALQSASQ